MQTFLPYPDIKKSFQVLDNKRLGKQRVETYQIISAITKRFKLDGTPYKGWINHPCSIMWKDYVPCLKHYFNLSIEEWELRGFKNNMLKEDIGEEILYPHWFGFEDFHSSHRANLLRKDFDFYSKWGWNENPQNPYVWLDNQNKWYKQYPGKTGKIYYEETCLHKERRITSTNQLLELR